MYMKFYTDGKIKNDSPLLTQLRKDLRVTDKRIRRQLLFLKIAL